VPEEQLNCPQIASAPVDQRRLGPAHGMRGVLERVQTDAADPLGDEAGVLPCRQMVLVPAAAWEQALANLPAASLGDSRPRLGVSPRSARSERVDRSCSA
jgi:hypothetical protein